MSAMPDGRTTSNPDPGRKVLGWHGELEIPNAALFVRPFGVYLRTRRFRLRVGPYYGVWVRTERVR